MYMEGEEEEKEGEEDGTHWCFPLLEGYDDGGGWW